MMDQKEKLLKLNTILKALYTKNPTELERLTEKDASVIEDIIKQYPEHYIFLAQLLTYISNIPLISKVFDASFTVEDTIHLIREGQLAQKKVIDILLHMQTQASFLEELKDIDFSLYADLKMGIEQKTTYQEGVFVSQLDGSQFENHSERTTQHFLDMIMTQTSLDTCITETKQLMETDIRTTKALLAQLDLTCDSLFKDISFSSETDFFYFSKFCHIISILSPFEESASLIKKSGPIGVRLLTKMPSAQWMCKILQQLPTQTQESIVATLHRNKVQFSTLITQLLSAAKSTPEYKDVLSIVTNKGDQ